MPKLLIVDENYALTHYLRDILRADGHLVDTAVGGLQGIERLKREAYELALVELGMSNLSGEDLARFIQRGHGVGGRCPVIFMRERPEIEPRSDVAHVALLDKPFTLPRLRAAIASATAADHLMWRRRFLRRSYARRTEMHLRGAATTVRARDLGLGGMGVSWVTCPFCQKDAHPGRGCARDRFFHHQRGQLALQFQHEGRPRDLQVRLSYTRPGPNGTEEAGLAFEDLTVSQVDLITHALA